MAVPMPHHRTSEFKALYGAVLEKLGQAFRTEHDVLMFTASGTGAFESAYANLLSPGDRVLCVTAGNFGDRWISIAQAYGADVQTLRCELGERPDVKRRLAFDRNRLLMEALLQDAGKASLSDEAEHKVYEEAIKQMASEEEVHARHILLPTEDEAKAVLAELKKGADFAALAKEKSKDPGGSEGGDLGYFTKDQMVPEFSAVAFKLGKGELSEPVKTQFGWHIIKVEDKRTKPTPSFDQVKAQIDNYIVHRAQAALVEKLRSGANIERLDQPAAPSSSLNPAAPAKK